MDGEKTQTPRRTNAPTVTAVPLAGGLTRKPLTLRSRIPLARSPSSGSARLVSAPFKVSVGADPDFRLTKPILSGRVRLIPRKLGHFWQDCDGFHRQVRISRKIGARRPASSALYETSQHRDSRNAMQHGAEGLQVVQAIPLPRRNFTPISGNTQDSFNGMTIVPDKFGEAAPGLR